MSEKKNLLVIHTDQQSSWTLSAYGGTLVDTPNVDSLARDGALFSNFFAPAAVCTPSRGCMLTGRFPHKHGAYVNNVPLNRDERTLAHVLRDEGYDTCYIGKWHLDGPEKPGWVPDERGMGFDDNSLMFNRGHWKSIIERGDGKPELSPEMGDEESYTTDWLTSRAVDYITGHASSKPDEPFFLMISIPDPHTPFSVREPYASMYDPADMPVPSTFHEEGRPSWATGTQTDIAGQGWTDEDVRKAMAQYCGEVKCIDDNVGRLLDALNERGLTDDTFVVFVTDHGEYLGEHGLYAKNRIYETAYHIPLLMRFPGVIQPGTKVERFVDMTDFMPTVLSLMGVPHSGREQGRDAAPLVQGESIRWDDEIYIHYSRFNRCGIFTPEYELAFVKDAESVLFDRRNDPEQVDNLYGRPEYEQVVRKLLGRIVEHHRKVESPALEWVEVLQKEIERGAYAREA